MKTYFGYSLEVPHRGTSDEYLQHMFLVKMLENMSVLSGWKMYTKTLDNFHNICFLMEK